MTAFLSKHPRIATLSIILNIILVSVTILTNVQGFFIQERSQVSILFDSIQFDFKPDFDKYKLDIHGFIVNEGERNVIIENVKIEYVFSEFRFAFTRTLFGHFNIDETYLENKDMIPFHIETSFFSNDSIGDNQFEGGTLSEATITIFYDDGLGTTESQKMVKID